MAEDNDTIIKETEGQPEKVTFTEAQQGKIDEIISKRLAERDAKHAKEMEDLNRKHQRDLEMSKLDEETRRKAEEEEKTKDLVARAEKAERALRIVKAESELAKAGLDTSLAETVMGADDDAMAANIEALTKASKALADRMYAERVGSPGAPRAPEGSPDSDDIKHIRQVMGLD